MAPTPKQTKRVHVQITKSAFIDCLLATAEAAVISPSLNTDSFARLSAYLSRNPAKPNEGNIVPPSLVFSETGLEIGGLIWGRRTRAGETVTIRVERMTPISAANRGDGFVEWTPNSVNLMQKVARSAKAPWSLVGDFHSHPLLEVPKADIIERRLFGPSQQDRRHRTELHKKGVSVIMSISLNNERERNIPIRKGISNVFIEISDFQIWMSAYNPSGRKKKPAPKISIE